MNCTDVNFRKDVAVVNIVCCCICFNVMSFHALTTFTTAFVCCLESNLLLLGLVGKGYI